MKILQTIMMVLAAAMLCSCTEVTLPVDASDITRIRISKFPGDTTLADIEDAETISRMISHFSFGDQRHLTVKHPLPILIDLYSGTNAVCHVSCENRMMRLGNWEYTMNRETAELIQKIIKK
jgi:hypothetical protein